jgi:hypothetical protein
VEIDSDTDSDNFLDLPDSKKHYLKGKGKNESQTTDQDFMTNDNILKRENESGSKMASSFLERENSVKLPSSFI